MSGRLDVEHAFDGEAVTIDGFIDRSFKGENTTLMASTQYSDCGDDGFDGVFQLNRVDD